MEAEKFDDKWCGKFGTEAAAGLLDEIRWPGYVFLDTRCDVGC